MHNKIIWLNLKIGYKRHFFHLLNWFPVVWEGSHITVLGWKHGGWGRFQDHPRHKLTQHDGVVGRRQVMCCYRVLGRRVHHYHKKHVQKSSSDTCIHYWVHFSIVYIGSLIIVSIVIISFYLSKSESTVRSGAGGWPSAISWRLTTFQEWMFPPQ